MSLEICPAAQTEADTLGRQLGLVVKLEAVQHLRPGAMLYEGIEVCDPETGQPIFRSRCLEVAWERQTDAQGQRRPTLCVIASQAEIEATRIDLAWRWLQRLLESQPGLSEGNVQFSAGEVTLRAGDRSQTLADVAALLETLPDKTQAQIDFHLVGVATEEPSSLLVVRDREQSPPATRIELWTDDNKLPCSLLALGVGALKPLGERCCFSGRIWANETPDGWNADVAGQLVDLNLDNLVTERFSHRLSGIGKATSLSARFRHGRLEEASGVLLAERGSVSRSLLDAAVGRLGLIPGENGTVPFNAANSPSTSDRLRYEELALSFALDASGLRLRGLCTTAEPGTILSDGRNRLLGQPLRESQPVAALVQMLVPPSTQQVPASLQADWWLHHLPVSDVLSSPGNETVIPTARHLRVNDTKPL